MKLYELEPGMLEYLEVILEASQSLADCVQNSPAAFLLHLAIEAARAKFIQSAEEQLPPNLSLLVIVSTSMTKDHEEEVEATIHDLQGFLCGLIHLSSIEL